MKKKITTWLELQFDMGLNVNQKQPLAHCMHIKYV